MVLIDYLKQNGLNVSVLSKLTKIPYATLHKGIEQRGVMKAQNLAKVANQLGLSMDEVFAMMSLGHPSNMLTQTLISERESGMTSGLYHHTQVHFAMSSTNLSGGNLTLEQIASIFDANSTGGASNVRDIVAAANTTSLFDVMLEQVPTMLSLSLLQRYALMIPSSGGTSGTFGNNAILQPAHKAQIGSLLLWYNALPRVSLQDIIKFHATFVRMAPHGSGVGALARIIMFKECLRTQNVPFIIHEDYKAFYLRGIDKFETDSTFLSDICLTMQESYQAAIAQCLGSEYAAKLSV